MQLKNEELISSTTRVSNADDAGRKFAVMADVEAAAGKVTRITSGTVDSLDGQTRLADFTRNNGCSFQLTSHKYDATVEELREMTTAAIDFLDALDAHVEETKE